MNAVVNHLAQQDVKLTLMSAEVMRVAFEVNAAMQALEQMRDKAESNLHQYEMMGRAATRALIADVYGVWVSAKESNHFETFIGNIREKLKQLGVTVKSNSKESGILIRYVFANASDKQVHVYGRALDVAYDEKKTPVGEFAKLVEETKGGFDGLRSKAPETPVDGSKAIVALSKCVAEHTIDTVENVLWNGDEKYSVVIAVRNDDDTADLKDALLTAEQKESILLRFFGNKTSLENPKKAKKVDPAIAALIREFEAKHAAQESKVTQLQSAVQITEQDGGPVSELKAQLFFESGMLDAMAAQVKALKATVKD